MDVSKRRTFAKVRTHKVRGRAGPSQARWQAVAAEDVGRRQCDRSHQAAGGCRDTYTLSLCQVAVCDTKTRAAVPVVRRNLRPFHLRKSWRLQLRPFKQSSAVDVSVSVGGWDLPVWLFKLFFSWNSLCKFSLINFFCLFHHLCMEKTTSQVYSSELYWIYYRYRMLLHIFLLKRRPENTEVCSCMAGGLC